MSGPIVISRRGLSLQDVADFYGVTVDDLYAKNPKLGKQTARGNTFDAVLGQAMEGRKAMSSADRREVAVGEAIALPDHARPASVGQDLSRATPAQRRHSIFRFVENRLQSSGRMDRESLKAEEFARLARVVDSSLSATEARDLFELFERREAPGRQAGAFGPADITPKWMGLAPAGRSASTARAKVPEPAKPAEFESVASEPAAPRTTGIKTAPQQDDEPEPTRADRDEPASRSAEAESADDGEDRRDDRDLRPEPVRRPRQAPDRQRTGQDSEPLRSDGALWKATDDPADMATGEPFDEPTDEPVREVAKEPVREVAKEPAKEPVSEVAKEPVREPAKEPVREVAKEPVREVAKEPVREVAKEPVREPAKEPVREVAKEPVGEPAKATTDEAAGEPEKDPAGTRSFGEVAQPSVPPNIPAPSVSPLFAKPGSIGVAPPQPALTDWLSPKAKAVEAEQVAPVPEPLGQPLVAEADSGPVPVDIEITPVGTIRVEQLPAVSRGMRTEPGPFSDFMPSARPLVTIMPQGQSPASPGTTIVVRTLAFDVAYVLPTAANAPMVQVNSPLNGAMLGTPMPGQALPASAVIPDLGTVQLPRLAQDALPQGMPAPAFTPDFDTGQPPGQLIEAFPERAPLNLSAMVMSGDVRVDPSMEVPAVLAPQAAHDEVVALVNTRPVEATSVPSQIPTLPSGQQAATRPPVDLSPSVRAVSPTNTGSIALIQRMMPFQQYIIPMRTYYDAQSARRWWLWYRNYTNVLPKVSVTMAGGMLPGTATEFERR